MTNEANKLISIYNKIPQKGDKGLLVAGGEDGATNMINEFFCDEHFLFRVQTLFNEKNPGKGPKSMKLGVFYGQFNKHSKFYNVILKDDEDAKRIFEEDEQR